MAQSKSKKIVIIGAGIGGLSAAVELAAAGMDVEVIEQAYTPGGKVRQFPSDAGPVDAGPTVLTMRSVFDDLFSRAHVTLNAESILARHWWQDGSSLDLFADPTESANVIADFAGREARQEFIAFSKKTRRLFDAFNEPVMQSAAPELAVLGKTVLRDFRQLLPAMAPMQTLAASLEKNFSDPRLRQLFGRYATYVGGSPFASPALLSLIWDVESRGVWRVKGGMRKLAKALEKVATERGAQFRYGTKVETITMARRRVTGVALESGERIDAPPYGRSNTQAPLLARYQPTFGPLPQNHWASICAITMSSSVKSSAANLTPSRAAKCQTTPPFTSARKIAETAQRPLKPSASRSS